MIRYFIIGLFAATAATGAYSAEDHSKKKNARQERKAEKGASCKVPAIGRCSSCEISCQPHETAVCAPPQLAGDTCARGPVCACK